MARSYEFTFERLTKHVAQQSDVCYSEALQIIPLRYSGNVAFYNHLFDGRTKMCRQRQGFKLPDSIEKMTAFHVLSSVLIFEGVNDKKKKKKKLYSVMPKELVVPTAICCDAI